MPKRTTLPFEEPEVKPFMEQTSDMRGYIYVPSEVTRFRPFLKRPFFEVFNADIHKLFGLPTLHMEILLILASCIKVMNISYIKRKSVAQECDVLDESVTQALRSLRQRNLVHKCNEKCPYDEVHHKQGVYLLNPYVIWRFDKFTWDKAQKKWVNIYRQACEEWDTYTTQVPYVIKE